MVTIPLANQMIRPQPVVVTVKHRSPNGKVHTHNQNLQHVTPAPLKHQEEIRHMTLISEKDFHEERG